MDAMLQERIAGRRTASIEPCRKFLQCCLLLLFVSCLGCAKPLRPWMREQKSTARVTLTAISTATSRRSFRRHRAATGSRHRTTCIVGFDPRAATVAIVDVDGLLLNNDATGLGSWGENPVSVFRERLDAIECDPARARWSSGSTRRVAA